MPSHIICISGPEGVGKDTLINLALKFFPQLEIGKKATTRPARPDDFDEAGHSKYTYLKIDDFMRERAAGSIVEHSVTATGGYYGSYVNRSAPGIEIRDLDVNGALQLYAKSLLVPGFPRVTLVGILPPCNSGAGIDRIREAQQLATADDGHGRYWFAIAGSVLVQTDMLAALEMRLADRGDADTVIAQKLQRAQWEIPEILGTWPHIIINDKLEEATIALCDLIQEAIDDTVEDRRFAAYSTSPKK